MSHTHSKQLKARAEQFYFLPNSGIDNLENQLDCLDRARALVSVSLLCKLHENQAVASWNFEFIRALAWRQGKI